MTVAAGEPPGGAPTPELLAGSALRRLHYKATRRAHSAAAARHHPTSPVPKVIVMGSSTASDKTVNTSTESGATVVTSVTGTDDSLDTETTDPHPPQPHLLDTDSPPPKPHEPTPYHRHEHPLVPNTAPPGYHRNGEPLFPGDYSSPAYTKTQSAADKIDSPRPGPARFVFDVPLPVAETESSRPSTPNTAKLNTQHAHFATAEKANHHSPKVQQGKYETHFKFDKPKSPKSEPLSEKSKSPKHETHFKYDKPKSPKRETHFKYDRPKSPKHETHFKFDKPKSPKQETHFKFEKPDNKYETHFRFDRPKSPVKRRGSEPRLKKRDYYKDGSDSVAKLRRQLEGAEVFHNRRRASHQVPLPSAGSRRQSTAAQVHVTANPLDVGGGAPAGRTTIVVQQPSLSLDYAGCATLLLREQDDCGRRRSKCSEQLQQLLDVTSQFTTEDLHDFDKRYGSPHHSRSQSVKAARTGERQLLGLPQQRARVASMPNTGVEEEYYRLRHFSITGKGVINRGDSLRSRRSRSNTSVASSASSERLTRASAPCSLASSRDSSAGVASYRVLVLGASGVGKSSLVGQFMTSEYLHAYDTSIDDESGERSVCVLLAGEESEITFLDSPPDSMVMEGSAHGYCVVYSTAERGSLAEAERRLQALWAGGHTARRAVILVGNKADLARSRAVPTEEGKSLATSYDCKFIETSVGINHNVDELLVGLLTQIRLKQQHAERARDTHRKRSGSRKNRSRNRSPLEAEHAEPPPPPPPHPPASAGSTPRKRGRLSASVKVRGLLGRVWARDSKSKSCENLHVL